MPTRFRARRGSTQVVFASGALGALGAELDAAGLERALVLCTPRAADAARWQLEQLGARLAGILATAVEHVPAAVVRAARDQVIRLGAQSLLGLGGGSAIGLGKALAAELDLPLVAVPTTYSGSEMTALYGVTDDGHKRIFRDERVRPRLVVYDSELTRSLPATVVVNSLWNAMAHAVEALWTRDPDPVVLAVAEDAIRLVARWMPVVADAATNDSTSRGRRQSERGETDSDARDGALVGAYLAGVALADGGTALHHKLCHVLGGMGLPHAATHAVLLPHVVRFHRDWAPDAMRRIARALGADDPAQASFDLARSVSAPSALGALGLRDEHVELAIDRLFSAPFDNPRPLERDSLRALLVAAKG